VSADRKQVGGEPVDVVETLGIPVTVAMPAGIVCDDGIAECMQPVGGGLPCVAILPTTMQ